MFELFKPRNGDRPISEIVMNDGKVLVLPGGIKKEKQHTFSVLIGICTYKGIKETQMFNVCRALENCPDPKIKIVVWDGDALIDRSRARLATKFMTETDADILFFLDDDIISNTMDLTHMMWKMWQNDYDILGGPYVIKSMKEKTFAIRLLEDKRDVQVGKDAPTIPIRYASTGCMGIRRRVFQKMIDKGTVHRCNPETMNFWPFFMPIEKNLNGKWVYLSEDWAFCERALNLGFKVWCDFSVRLEHIGPYAYDWSNFFNDIKKAPDNFVLPFDVKKE